MENLIKMEFGEIAELRKEKFNPVNSNESKPCLELEHFEQATGKIIGFISSLEQKSIKNVFYKGDVLFGKLRPYLRKYWLAEFDGVCSSEVWVLKPKTTDISNSYLFNLIQTNEFIQAANVSSGSKMPRADWGYIINYPFSIINSKNEQTTIANLLSTWDNAITKTQALIAQKEQRKKWLMQNLLTGKMRLKGFEKTKWKKVGAGEIFESFTKKGFENEELLSATQDRGIIPRSQLEGRVTMPEGTTVGYKLVEPGDFIISLRSFQGGLEYSYFRGIVSPAYIVLKPKEKIEVEFYKQYYKSYEFIGRLATAVIGIRDGKQVSYDDFCIVKIPFPSYEEQTAIAQVLQAADKEIQLLKTKCTKLKEQKKGLMQVLLTGKKRLII